MHQFDSMQSCSFCILKRELTVLLYHSSFCTGIIWTAPPLDQQGCSFLVGVATFSSFLEQEKGRVAAVSISREQCEKELGRNA
jgi:hypothetical protein